MDAFTSSDIHQQRMELTEANFQQQFNDTTSQLVEQSTNYMNTELLGSMMNKLAKTMEVPYLEKSAVIYLALATQHRLQECISNMIEASRHRVDSQTAETPPLDNKDQPLYKVANVQDIRKQLLAIERVEREEERKRRQAMTERERNAHLSDGGGAGGGAGGDDGVDGDDDMGSGNKKKKKKKKEMGPGATARNLSEDVYKQATNKTALMSAGGIRKSWMLAGMTNTSGPNKETSSFPSSTTTPSATPPPPPPSSSSSSISSSTEPSHLPSTSPSSSTKLPSSSSRLTLAPDLTSLKHEPEETATRGGGRGRPRGRKTDGSSKRGRSSSKRDRAQDFYLPPSMIGRHHQSRLGDPPSRTVTIIDAVHALEYELDSGCECGNRALIKSYNQYLK